MNYYSYLALTLSIFTGVNLFSQDVQVFNDKFRDGRAEYEYYTDENYDIIYCGYMRYYGEKYTVLGNYKDDLPDGEWIIKAADNVYANWQTDIQINAFVKGSYKKGLLNGNWVYENSFSLPAWGTNEFRTGDEIDKDISEAKFLNGVFIGDIKFSRNFQKVDIIGSFDNEGTMSGTWTYTKPNEVDEIKYKNGVAYWRLIRELPTGQQKLFIDSTEFVNKFWSNYNTKSNISAVDGVIYYAQKVELDGRERVGNSVVKLTNRKIEYRDNYDNPAISIWQAAPVNIYQSYNSGNPLYYGSRGSEIPVAYEILIKKCYYDSNEGCTTALNDIRKREDMNWRNQKMLAKISLVDEQSKTLSRNLEKIKLDYSQNYQKSLAFLKEKFVIMPNEAVSTEKYVEWTTQDENYYSNLKNTEAKVGDYEKFHKAISTALENNDKTTLKLLKGKSGISELVSSVLK